VDPKGAGRAARAAVSRLLAESHKAGMRVVLVAQRADAAVIGGAERANLGGRLSFRVDNPDAVRMLHPAADAAVIAEHLDAPAGVALLSLPGVPLARVRGPYIGDYRAFVAGVSHDRPVQ
jgi:S-DNA-T family DNA segregation ATPase FtsK/SpoIIIE